MNLADNRFLAGQLTYRDNSTEEVKSIPMYSYETKDKLYDVAVEGPRQYVRVNMGPWSNRIDAWQPIHHEIAKHFNII